MGQLPSGVSLHLGIVNMFQICIKVAQYKRCNSWQTDSKKTEQSRSKDSDLERFNF